MDTTVLTIEVCIMLNVVEASMKKSLFAVHLFTLLPKPYVFMRDKIGENYFDNKIFVNC